MQRITQLIPISTLRNNYREVFKQIKDKTIILTQRNQPAAVLVSVDEWDRRARRLIELEGLLETKQALAQIDSGHATTTTLEELKQQLAQPDAGPVEGQSLQSLLLNAPTLTDDELQAYVEVREWMNQYNPSERYHEL